MKWKPYPKYKESGINWLGEVPEHWPVCQSRRLFALRNSRAVEADVQLTASQKHGIIERSEFMKLEDQKVMEVITGADILKHVEPNDFVISMRSFQGGLEWSHVRGCISSAYVMLIPSPLVCAPYFAHVFKSQSYIQALQATSNLVRDGQALRYSNFALVPLVLPPLSEQDAIATRLDRETAKIDTLVSKQERLIELLQEKRQALISHAVTKGLNPNAPMKPSGVEWLGEMPEHWESLPLSAVATVIDPNPSHRNPVYTDGGFPFISTVEFVGDDDILLETPRRVAEVTVLEQERRCSFRQGSIAFSRKGTIGAVRVLPHNVRFALLDSVCVINCHNRLRYRYLYRQLGSEVVAAQLGALVRGAALSQVSVGRVRGIRVLVPPIDEQAEIERYIDSETARLNTAISRLERAIELLREHRTALISAAVTGKIDARENQTSTHA